MDVSPRTVAAVIVIAGAAMFGVFDRAQTAAPRGPAPNGARYRLHGGGDGTIELNAKIRAATFTIAPGTAPSDRELVLEAVASSRPEARRLIELVDGLVDVSVGDAGSGAAGKTMIGGARYPMILNVRAAWQRAAQRGVDRLVLHELGHVVDAALLSDAFVAPLVAAVPTGWGCDDGVTGSCAAPEERFAESFAKWATGDIGIDVAIGYSIPPPSPSLDVVGSPARRLERLTPPGIRPPPLP